MERRGIHRGRRLGNRACAPKAGAPPPAFKRVAGNGIQHLPSVPRSFPGTQSANTPLIHTLTHPLPADPQDPRGASGLKLAAAAFPATGLGGTSLRLRAEWGGASRAGPFDLVRAGGFGDKIRKREASTITLLSESIPYIESKIITQLIFF